VLLLPCEQSVDNQCSFKLTSAYGPILEVVRQLYLSLSVISSLSSWKSSKCLEITCYKEHECVRDHYKCYLKIFIHY
jgi:hypothetical protein